MKNRIENTLISLATAAVVALILYMIAIKPIRQDYKELAKEPKYKIENTFEKIKTTDDGRVVLQLDNRLYELKPYSADSVKTEPKKKGFFGRLFNNKNKKK